MIPLAFIAGGIIIYHIFFKSPPPKLYQTTKPRRKTITQTVSASGVLTIKDPICIGCVVSGTVKKLHVKENDYVKKGQLLAYIDPGTGETDYQISLYNYQQKNKEFIYLQNNFKRQKELYKANQLAKDAFEALEKNLEIASLNLKQAKSNLEKEKLNLENRNIFAVQAGFITEINITEGSGVSGVNVSSLSAKIFEIAPNICNMEAKLDIDESDIGLIQPGQSVNFTVNTYPDKLLFTTIRDIGFSPKITDGTAFYKATVDIENKNKLFRPGMTIDAKIKISQKPDTLCVKNIVFQINPKALKTIAKILNFSYYPLPKNFKIKFQKNHPLERIKSIWTVNQNSFNEVPVILGIVNEKYVEIKTGLKETDLIISDIAEEDVMTKIYKKWFEGPL
ncbi:MAG: efflux RND transporter periplasmic adaptor subunit [bacterium]